MFEQPSWISLKNWEAMAESDSWGQNLENSIGCRRKVHEGHEADDAKTDSDISISEEDAEVQWNSSVHDYVVFIWLCS